MVKKEGKVNVTIRVFHTDLNVSVPISEEQNYLNVAEYVTQRIDACAKAYASSKPLMEIMLLVMLDITHNSMKQQYQRGISRIWNRIIKLKQL